MGKIITTNVLKRIVYSIQMFFIVISFFLRFYEKQINYFMIVSSFILLIIYIICLLFFYKKLTNIIRFEFRISKSIILINVYGYLFIFLFYIYIYFIKYYSSLLSMVALFNLLLAFSFILFVRVKKTVM
jgi:hypothetical protein